MYHIMTCVCVTARHRSFTAPQILRALSIHPSLASPLPITNLFVVSTVFPFTKCHGVGITQHGAFQIGFFHMVINMHWRFLRAFSGLNSFFPFSVNIPLSGWTTADVSHSPASGYLGSSQALAIRNNTFINTCVQALFGHKFSTHLDKYLDMQVCSVVFLRNWREKFYILVFSSLLQLPALSIILCPALLFLFYFFFYLLWAFKI